MRIGSRWLWACVLASSGNCGLAAELLGESVVLQGRLAQPYAPSAVPTADGGAVLHAGSWLFTLDATGRVVERERAVRSGALRAAQDGSLVLFDGPYESPDVPLVDVCRVDRVGQRLLTGHTTHAWELVATRGFFEHAPIVRSYLPSEPLYWFGTDCRATPAPVLYPAQVQVIEPVPGQQAAYIVTRNPGDTPGEMVRLGRDRVHWRIPAAGTPYATADGGVHVVRTLASTDTAPPLEIRRLDASGALRWTRVVPRVRVLARIPDGLLLGTSAGANGRAQVISLDDAGNERWRSEVPAVRLTVEVPTVAGAPIRAFVGVVDGARTIVLAIELATGRIEVLLGPQANVQPLAVLAGAGVLLSRDPYGAPTLELWTAGASTAVAIAPEGLVPDAPRALASLVTDDGARFIVAQAPGDGVMSLVRMEPDGTSGWRRVLERGLFTVSTIRVAANADRVCLLRSWRLREAPFSGIRLECNDARTGQPRFEPRIFAASAGQARLLVSGDATVVYAVPLQARELGMTTLDASGRELSRRAVPLRDSSRFDVAATGEVVVLDFEEIRGFSSALEPRWSTRAAALAIPSLGSRPVVALADGALIVGGDWVSGDVAVRLDAEGRERWRFRGTSFGSYTRLGGDWLVLARQLPATSVLSRLDDRDGRVVWQHAERWAGNRYIVTASADGRRFAVAPETNPDPHISGRYAGDTWWFDGGTGRRLAAIPGARSVPEFAPHGLLRIEPQGTLSRLVSRVEPQGGSLVLERWKPEETGNPAARARRFAAGRWTASELAGQSIDLVVDAQGRIDGRWLTYSLERANDPAEQRGYRLTGSTDAAGAEVELAIADSRGAFEFANGSATWRQLDCTRAELEYRFKFELENVTGRMALVRDDAFDCERLRERPQPAIALWTAADGNSVVLHAAQDGTLRGAWTTHAPSTGAPQWLSLAGGVQGSFTVERSIGGRFETHATTNTHAIGTARIESVACDRIRLRYAFLPDELAEPFARLAGTIELRRVGGCVQPRS